MTSTLTAAVDKKAMRHAATVREQFRVSNFHMTTQQESDRVFLEAYEAAKAPVAERPIELPKEVCPYGGCPRCIERFGGASPVRQAIAPRLLTDQQNELDIGIEVIGLTLGNWIEFNQQDGKGDDQFVITPATWPSIGVLKVWIAALERARAALKRLAAPLTDEQREKMVGAMSVGVNDYEQRAYRVMPQPECREGDTGFMTDCRAALTALEQHCTISWKGGA